MNEKVTLQTISDIFSSQYGLSKKTTDAFGKSFFDTIVDGLNQDGQVKIKGLGTFKVVDVSSRESVNVTNGERIVIDGYRKVTFTPDEFVEQNREEQIKQVENTVAEATAQSEDNSMAQIETLLKKAENDAAAEVSNAVSEDNSQPGDIETPKDEFSGIDNLISTPESIGELKKDLEQAEAHAKQTLEEAKKANIEYRRLQILLEHLEKNQAPEALVREIVEASLPASEPVALASATPANEPIVEPIAEENALDETDQSAESEDHEETESLVKTDQPAETEPAIEVKTHENEEIKVEGTPVIAPEPKSSHEEALRRFLSNTPDEYEGDEEEEYENAQRRKRIWICLLLLILILAGVAAFFYYRTTQYQVYDMSEPEGQAVPADTVITQDSLSNADDTTVQSVPVQKADVKPNDAQIKTAKQVEADKKAAEAKKFADKKAADAKTATATKAAAVKLADKKASESKVPAAQKTAATKRNTEPAAPKAPKTHVMAKGQSLTKISQMYYGDKNHIGAIIKANNFKDPDNVPIGTVVNLP